jgi:hypothetical protein
MELAQRLSAASNDSLAVSKDSNSIPEESPEPLSNSESGSKLEPDNDDNAELSISTVDATADATADAASSKRLITATSSWDVSDKHVSNEKIVQESTTNPGVLVGKVGCGAFRSLNVCFRFRPLSRFRLV